eukprot:scaffold13674_cov61-Phaeocystis_antarctica.AAC.4
MTCASTLNLLNVPTEVDISSPLLFTCLVALRAEVEISVLLRHSRSAALNAMSSIFQQGGHVGHLAGQSLAGGGDKCPLAVARSAPTRLFRSRDQ